MTDKKQTVPPEIRNDPDYLYARSCAHCTDTADSQNAYVSTYCHMDHVHLFGFGTVKPFPCRDCQNYTPRHGDSSSPATPKDAGCLRNRVRYEQPMTDSDHRNVLWYGGDVLSVEKDGCVLTLRANGDVIAEYRDGDQVIKVRDKSCHGIFAEKLAGPIHGDADLLELIAAGHNENAPRALTLTDGNWWEVFVTKDGLEISSTVLDSDNYDEALTEMLESIAGLLKEGQ